MLIIHFFLLILGKMNRGLSVVDTLKILKNDQLTTEELFKSRVLGWCVEWVRVTFNAENCVFALDYVS